MLHPSVWRTYATIWSTTDAAAVLLSTAGAIHVAAAPQHWGHSPAHGLFLFGVGLGELVWAAAFWRRPSHGLRAAGAVLAGASIVLWAITRLLPAPFGHGPEAVGLIDAASKLPELLVLGMLLLEGVLAPTHPRLQMPRWVQAAGLLSIACAAGLLAFWLATAAAPALPWLGRDRGDESSAVAAAPVRARVADSIQVVVGGIGTPLTSGDQLPVAGDLEVQIALAPGGARFRRDLDVHLFRSGRTPVSDATIVVTGHMRFMDHGSFRQAATPSGDGQYALPLAFVMPGAWQVDLEIVTPAERGAVHLDLDLTD